MKYTVRESIIWVVGTIWMPAVEAATHYKLSQYDVDNIKAEGDGVIDREAVQDWLDTNAGDFQAITDFAASIEDGEETVDIDWATVEGEDLYIRCTCPA